MATSTRRRTAHTVYRRWLRRGFSPAAAGNLTALQLRIRPSPATPWTPEGIEKLLSLRFQVRKGWIEGDTSI